MTRPPRTCSRKRSSGSSARSPRPAAGNAHAWLSRVATNLVVSQVRAPGGERHLADLDHDPLAASPEQLVLVTERDAEVRLAVDDLPTDARVALLLAARGFSGRRSRIRWAGPRGRFERSCADRGGGSAGA